MALQSLKPFLYRAVLNYFPVASQPVLTQHAHLGMPHRTEHHQLSTGTNSLGSDLGTLCSASATSRTLTSSSLPFKPSAVLRLEIMCRGCPLVSVAGPYHQGHFLAVSGPWAGWMSSRDQGICTGTKQGSFQRLPSALVT